MLKIDRATELDYREGKRGSVYKDGLQIGDIRTTLDGIAWLFRITLAKNMMQGEPLIDLMGEELERLYKVVSNQKYEPCEGRANHHVKGLAGLRFYEAQAGDSRALRQGTVHW